jgi:hypothetical protein
MFSLRPTKKSTIMTKTTESLALQNLCTSQVKKKGNTRDSQARAEKTHVLNFLVGEPFLSRVEMGLHEHV